MKLNFSVHLLGCLLILTTLAAGQDTTERPRVFVTTDINNGSGDPDDRQSLCHLLWYADVLDIRGIVPDRFSETALEACHMVFDLYEKDYANTDNQFQNDGFPEPDYFREHALLARPALAIERLVEEANQTDESPLYVLVWGNMSFIGKALKQHPEIADKIRMLTIGTFRKAKENGGDGVERNWNGHGRQAVYDAFPHLWWVEIEWTYNGMFPGHEPVKLKEDLAHYGGELGQHIKDVIATVAWARNFRAGDTPSVLYLIDPDHDVDDPGNPSWAGQFTQPFPEKRPHFWTGVTGGQEWDFVDPSKTWDKANAVYEARVQSLLDQRPEMYAALLKKVQQLYAGNTRPTSISIAATAQTFDGTSPLLLEAESAEITARFNKPTDSKASNETYVSMNQPGSLVWHFESIAPAGEHPITFHYRSPQGTQSPRYFVNSALMGPLEFRESKVWTTKQLTVHLEKGPNSIVIEARDEAMDVDALTIGVERPEEEQD